MDWPLFVGVYLTALGSVALIPVGHWVIDRITF